ncbi:7-cyano-7-deazaguanine synthase [Candidatus Nitrosacidococcus tergens]|uniref:7-cyano-7-deazaguanine synthase n=2 Tax=Candidatus Nitrosacidococcus tergens TaxID=553981 RepID=A0A7G1QBI5_9GAMM|nr:7-cyano-7-deazaguanine synthase [Candidatus Nitrosacidococcus tergens]
MTKAVILLSGGLDSSTVLAIARSQGYSCYAISFNYGQKNKVELEAAQEIAQHFKVADHKIINIDLGNIGGSALTDSTIPIPKASKGQIPVTYVPARNTLFLAFALGWAEVLDIQNIFIGVNSVDYSGYPDCRPEFIAAFEQLANLATKVGMEGKKIRVQAPLIGLSKKEVINQGISLGVDYSHTISCYQIDDKRRACGICDACTLRKKGFLEARIKDPTIYR